MHGLVAVLEFRTQGLVVFVWNTSVSCPLLLIGTSF